MQFGGFQTSSVNTWNKGYRYESNKESQSTNLKQNKSHVTIEEMSENTFWPSY